MTPVERLQAAIDKLERLRDESGSFKQWNGGDFQDVTYEDGHCVGAVGPVTISMWDGSEQNPDDGTWRDSSAVLLMQTLHRTIDAQLAILRDVLEAANIERNWDTLVYTLNALALADAILGGDS